MIDDLGYGKRLSDEEYDRSIIELYRNTSSSSKDEDAKTRRQELNLSIDYRLGVDFPLEKREALWSIMQRVEKKRLWLALKYGLGYLLFKKRIPKELSKETNGLVGYLVDEFSTVLSKKELNSFFEMDEKE